MPENWDESDEQDLKTTEVLQDYAWKALQSAEEQFSRIDSKAVSLTGFVGVITTILVGIYSASFPSPHHASWLYFLSRIALILLLISLFASFAASLTALYPRKITNLPRIPVLVGMFIELSASKHAHRTILKQIINQTAQTEASIYEATSKKELWLTKAAICLWIGLICGLISITLFIADTNINQNDYQQNTATRGSAERAAH